MAAGVCPPVITSIIFDQASYMSGQTITATVFYTACCAGPFNAIGSDNGGRVWTVTSDDHTTTATLTAIA